MSAPDRQPGLDMSSRTYNAVPQRRPAIAHRHVLKDIQLAPQARPTSMQ
ncbi:hypothetical protein [Nannocystis pusilla]